jgi:quercetin dioxygenase-like cupin family protein
MMEFARGRQPQNQSFNSAHLSQGAAWRDQLLDGSGVTISTIAFAPGAHIRWHAHENGQILLIDHGKGVIATRAGELHSLQAADVVYALPGEQHWHGALPDVYLGQVNISMGSTTWFEDVTEEAYRDAVEKIQDL